MIASHYNHLLYGCSSLPILQYFPDYSIFFHFMFFLDMSSWFYEWENTFEKDIELFLFALLRISFRFPCNILKSESHFGCLFLPFIKSMWICEILLPRQQVRSAYRFFHSYYMYNYKWIRIEFNAHNNCAKVEKVAGYCTSVC